MSGSTCRKRERDAAAGARRICGGSDTSGTPISSAALAASSTTATPCFLASARTPRIWRTLCAVPWAWMVRQSGADRRPRRSPRARAAPAWSAACASADRDRRCDATRAARADARAGAAASSDRSAARAGRSTAPGRDGQSSRAAPRRRRPRLRRSHRDAPCDRQSGSSETVRPAAAEARAVLRQTSTATCRFVVPWMRVSAQWSSQRSR